MQESFDLNPDWLLLKWLFCFTKLKISSKMSFSRKIEHIGKNKTGRQLLIILAFIGFFAFLWNGTRV